MAVVPVDSKVKSNYQATIVVAGAQMPFEIQKNLNQPYFGKESDIVDSSEKSILCWVEGFGIFPGILTPQSDDIDILYQITEER